MCISCVSVCVVSIRFLRFLNSHYATLRFDLDFIAFCGVESISDNRTDFRFSGGSDPDLWIARPMDKKGIF